MRYSRTEIKHYLKDDPYTTPELLNKWACQVFIHPLDPEYAQRIENGQSDFITLLIGNSWEEVNNKFNEMNKKECEDDG